MHLREEGMESFLCCQGRHDVLKVKLGDQLECGEGYITAPGNRESCKPAQYREVRVTDKTGGSNEEVSVVERTPAQAPSAREVTQAGEEKQVVLSSLHTS